VNNEVNTQGLPETHPSAFEELLVNALIHMDNLTVEKICSSISNIRNPILVSYAAKGLLPYKGLGSGIKRALEDWPDISFTDDREGSMFIATVYRKELDDSESAEKSTQKNSQKTSQKIIELMQNDPTITIADLARHIGITERAIKMQIEKMKAQGRIQRIGPDKAAAGR